jgi:hypothetical protein
MFTMCGCDGLVKASQAIVVVLLAVMHGIVYKAHARHTQQGGGTATDHVQEGHKLAMKRAQEGLWRTDLVL